MGNECRKRNRNEINLRKIKLKPIRRRKRLRELFRKRVDKKLN